MDTTTESHLLQVWLPDTIGVPMREAAKRNERSLSAEVRYALKRHLETSEAVPGPGHHAPAGE